MSVELRRPMRLLVFFDLPTITKANKRAYVLFRRFLLNEGYDMIQWSVYSRILAGREAERMHVQRIRANLPQEGSVRCMTVTEKQYAGIQLLVGERKTQEKKVNADQLLLF